MDVSKLPQWAQQRITKLEGDIEWWKGKVTAAQEGDTNTFIGDWPEDIGLPPDSRIIFRLPEGEKIEVRVQGESLYVAVRGGSGPLAIQPEVSNVCRIMVGRRP